MVWNSYHRFIQLTSFLSLSDTNLLSYRTVMRKEAVYTLLLNVTLFAGMKCSLAQDPRYVRFSVIEGAGASTSGGGGENVVLGNGNGAATVTTHYNLRVGCLTFIIDRLSNSDSASYSSQLFLSYLSLQTQKSPRS